MTAAHPSHIPGEMLVACDGSCLRNPGGPIGWAWVAQTRLWFTGSASTGTNQIAELQALLAVLRDFPKTPLVIQIDSMYVLNVATRWRGPWKRNGWVATTGRPVANLDLVRSVDTALTERGSVGVRFVKVPSHDPKNRWPLNTEADRRARDAAQRERDHARRQGKRAVNWADTNQPGTC